MPNPRAGTIAQGDDLTRLITEARLGRVEFRVDRTSNLHAPVGKASFAAPELLENVAAFVNAVKKARPPAAKGSYIRKMVFASCMGPGIKVDPVAAQAMEAA
jgi:large subunit ribosomal protein L1